MTIWKYVLSLLSEERIILAILFTALSPLMFHIGKQILETIKLQSEIDQREKEIKEDWKRKGWM